MVNRDETTRFLRARSGLTSQPYGADAIEAWQGALEHDSYDHCISALRAAAREHQKITLAHIVERLPRKRVYDGQPATKPFVMTDHQREINERGFAMCAEILDLPKPRDPAVIDRIIRRWMPNAQLEDQ